MSASVILVAGLLTGAVASAAEWPQWRGPDSLGVSSETGLPTEWSVTKNLAWRSALAGLGASSPITVGDLVIVTSQVGSYSGADGGDPRLARDDRSLASQENGIGAVAAGKPVQLVVEAFRKADGRRAWEFRMAAEGPRQELHEKHNLATPTPASDGERIYAWFGNGQLVALDLAGKLVWRRHLGLEYGSFLNSWGHGSSPALYRDLLILLVDHRPVSYLLALDKRTGQQRWKTDRSGKERVSHSTPVILPGPKGDEMIINSTERVDAYSPATGEILWHAGEYRQTPIPTAVFHDGVIYMARGYRNSDIWAIKPGGRGDVTASHVVYRIPNGGSYVPSILHYQGLLYMTNEVGVVTCADAASGQPLWKTRLGGIFFASPVGAGGRIYLLSETGETYVLRAGRKAELLATNNLEGRFIASPAISGGRIYLRADGMLYSVSG